MPVETSNPPFTPPPEPIPPLRDGDRMTWDEFERRWDATPEIKKAELLEGVVCMPPPPVSGAHSVPHFDLIGWLFLYRIATPGVVGDDNATVRLDMANAPQPDALLRILPSHGGHAVIDARGYIQGAPELAAEVAVSSLRIDLNVKLPIYRRHGVREYLIWRVPDREIDWFVLRGTEYERLAPGADGVYRSETLPGLWLDAAALVRGDLAAVGRVAQQGLASPEHAAFVQRLQEEAARRGV